MAKKTAQKKTPTLVTGQGLFAAQALTFAASANKSVTFTCSNNRCLVTVVAGLLKARFVGKGQLLMPVGTYRIDVAVDGPPGSPFTFAATGATMTPWSSKASKSARLPITV